MYPYRMIAFHSNQVSLILSVEARTAIVVTNRSVQVKRYIYLAGVIIFENCNKKLSIIY